MKPIAIFALMLGAITATAQQPAAFEWTGSIQPKQTLEIRNIVGDIKAETATGSDVEISVRILGTRPDPGTIHIDVVQHDGGILLCTIYEGLSRPDHCAVNQTPSLTLTNSDVRVMYTVRVPPDVNFVPRSVNGNISADLGENSISANTVNGRIVLSSGRPSDAHVINGTVVATLTQAEWEGTHEFAAVNGNVDIQVPASAQISVRASNVWGSLSNDFGIAVHRYLVGSWFEGKINDGGGRLVLVTVNGSVHLRRPPE